MEKHSWSSIEPLLCQLPAVEDKLLRLVHADEMMQKEIAKQLGVARGYMVRFLRQAILRLEFLFQKPVFTDEEIRALLSPYVRPKGVDVFVALYHCNSRKGAADSIGCSVSLVNRYMRQPLHQLKQINDPKMKLFIDFIGRVNTRHWPISRADRPKASRGGCPKSQFHSQP